MVDDEPPIRIWPKAVIITAVFLVGGLLGYLIGRPTHTPAPSNQLQPGQVRVPNLDGLSNDSATKVLESLGLQDGTVTPLAAVTQPKGIVLDQTPVQGTVVHSGLGVSLRVSNGPGPPLDARYVFARGLAIPITHTGPYLWRSGLIVLAGRPASFGANTRVIGGADVTPYVVSPHPQREGIGMTVSFTVKRFQAPSWFVILRAYARQHEVGLGGRKVIATADQGVVHIGGSCVLSSRAQEGRLVATVRTPAGARVGSFVLGAPVAMYAFRASVPIPAKVDGRRVVPGDLVTFRVAGECNSRPVVVATRP